MKRLSVFLILLLLVSSLFTSYAFEGETDFDGPDLPEDKIDDGLPGDDDDILPPLPLDPPVIGNIIGTTLEPMYLGDVKSGTNDSPIYLDGIPVYDEFSHDGYEEITVDGKRALIRIRHAKLDGTDTTLTNTKYICNLYPGMTYSVSESFGDSKTSTTTWSNSVTVSSSFKVFGQKISASVTSALEKSNSHTVSYTIQKGRVFAFPTNAPPEATYVKLYSGFVDDLYELTYDFVPYETHTKTTTVNWTSVSTPPPYPDEDEGMHKVDVYAGLADGRQLHWEYFMPPHHYNAYKNNLEEYPQVKSLLADLADGYDETTQGFNYDNREEMLGEIRVPIPFIRYQYIN